MSRLREVSWNSGMRTFMLLQNPFLTVGGNLVNICNLNTTTWPRSWPRYYSLEKQQRYQLNQQSTTLQRHSVFKTSIGSSFPAFQKFLRFGVRATNTLFSNSLRTAAQTTAPPCRLHSYRITWRLINRYQFGWNKIQNGFIENDCSYANYYVPIPFGFLEIFPLQAQSLEKFTTLKKDIFILSPSCVPKMTHFWNVAGGPEWMSRNNSDASK